MATLLRQWARAGWLPTLSLGLLLGLLCGSGCKDNPVFDPDAALDTDLPDDGADGDADPDGGGETSRPVNLLIEPPAWRDQLVATHWLDVLLEPDAELDEVVLQGATTVRGSVLFNALDGGLGEPVAAELRFVRTDGIPGFGGDVLVRSERSTGEYVALVPPGIYDVSISPNRTNVSRMTAHEVQVGTSDLYKAFSIPAPAEYRVVTGTLVRGVDRSRITGARVFARSPESGLESTFAVSDDQGKFAVLIPPTQSPFEFYVRPAEGMNDVPTAVFEAVRFQGSAPVSELELSLGPALRSFPLEIRLQTPDGEPVENAALVVVSSIDAWVGSPLSPGLQTGTYTLRFPPAVYPGGVVQTQVPLGRVEIFAASTEPGLGPGVYDAFFADTAGEDGAMVREIIIETQHRVEGRIWAPEGHAGPAEVEIEASLLESELFPLSRYLIPPSAFTQRAWSTDDGTFAFTLSPGIWELRAIPPPGHVSARSRMFVEVARGSVQNVQLRLAVAMRVSGRVVDGQGEPVAGASIKAFSPQGRLLGNAVTDAAGDYYLQVPVPGSAVD